MSKLFKFTLCFIGASLLLVGCGSTGKESAPIIPSPIVNQFTITKDLGELVDINDCKQHVYIIEDRETNIQYLWVRETRVFGGAGGITPYLGKEGQITRSK